MSAFDSSSSATERHAALSLSTQTEGSSHRSVICAQGKKTSSVSR